MDFLKIREKAKAMAAERAARGPTPSAPAPAAGEGGGEVAPEAAAAATDADLLEGALAARLQGLPAAVDDRFTTWRPGAGAAPVLPEAPPPPGPGPGPQQGDFAVVSAAAGPPGALAALAPAAAAPEPALPGAPPPPPDPLDEFFFREDEVAPPVPLVGAAARAAREDAADVAAREEYLTFLLGEEEYAVAIERVREVLKVPPLTEVPRAPRVVLGVVTVRGEVVAVFDPRARLALPGPAPAAGAGRLVIVDAGEGPCGLLVDAVRSVVRLRAGSIEPRPQGIGGAAAECLAGIGRQGGRLFTVLDLAAFFRRPVAPPRDEDRRARP